MHQGFKFTRALLLGATILLTCVASRAAFTVSGRSILNDGVPFSIKGVCYNPTPIGDTGSRSPNGDYYTSGYSAIWNRDLPQLRAMGANVIRIYGWNPTADHTAFLNACYNNGDHPIYVLVNYWVDPNSNWTSNSTINGIKSNFTNIETRLNNHPAVLGLIIGNEVNSQNNNGWNASFWSVMNTVAGAIKGINSHRLVSVAITDALDQMSSANGNVPNIDFWCMQIYRGTSFGSFFNDYAARSARPVVISEYGIDNFNHATNSAYPNSGSQIADLLVNLWTEIAHNSSVCAGGCLFEFSDEWFRASGTDTTQDPGGWAAGGFPDGIADEEWFGLFSIASGSTSLNVLTPRASFYELAAVWNPVTTPTPPPPTVGSSITDSSFETVGVGSNTFYAFAYDPVVSGWTYSGNVGLAGNGSGFTSGNPNAPDGTQVAFIQMTGVISTQVNLSAGSYTVSAMTANRANWGGQQSVAVLIDGVQVGTFTGGVSYQLSNTNAFTVAAGTHEVRLAGQASVDATLFLDKISIQAAATSVSVAVGNSGFEAPSVGTGVFGAFQYAPGTVAGTQPWTFAGNSGVAGNSSGFTGGNPAAPQGTQVAFLQMNTAVVSQTLTFPSSGNYVLTVSAAQRGQWQASRQVVQVYVDSTFVGSVAPSGSNYETIGLAFSATSGSHSLSFRGTATDDSTVLLDNVSLATAP